MEQLLTTGGGWQDQVAGILGGIQKGYSEAVLPLTVKSERINVSTDTHKRLNAHLMLIYTGKVRLAKNLLQVFLKISLISFSNILKHFVAQIFFIFLFSFLPSSNKTLQKLSDLHLKYY